MILAVLFNTMIRADELIKLDIGDVVIDSDIPNVISTLATRRISI